MSESSDTAGPGFRPLYRQVKEILIQRLHDGTWRPGTLIPSEMQIAAELGVSQGTVRKALDEMSGERLLSRQQGRGTFVTRHDEARILFQFFKIVPDGGAPVFPESALQSVVLALAADDERAALKLAADEEVVRIARVRSLNGRPMISEYITVPARIFPGLGHAVPVQNNLYDLYASTFGVMISGGEERVKAIAAPQTDAELLAIPAGSPVLAIDRIARALDGQPIEWRRSLCATSDCAYITNLSG